MSILKKNTDGTLPAVPAADGILSNVTDVLSVPFMAADEFLDSRGALVTMVTSLAIGAVGGGWYARKRATAGTPATFGFLF